MSSPWVTLVVRLVAGPKVSYGFAGYNTPFTRNGTTCTTLFQAHHQQSVLEALEVVKLLNFLELGITFEVDDDESTFSIAGCEYMRKERIPR